MFRNHLTIAWRILTRNRVYTLISTASLALGVCGCIIIWLVASHELSFDKFHPNGARIYRVGSGKKKSPVKEGEVMPPVPAAMRQTIPGLENVTAFFPLNDAQNVNVPNGDRPPTAFDAYLPGRGGPVAIIADDQYFNIFKYQWLAGNPTHSLKQPFRVVLTESRARLYFGPASPASYLGKELIYEDSLHVFVSGIIRDWQHNTDLPYTDFLSFPTLTASFLKNVRNLNDWVPHKGMSRWYWPTCFVKLAKGTSPEKVEAQLDIIGKRVDPGPDYKPKPGEPAPQFDMHLQPLADIHFNEEYFHENIRKAHLPTIYAMMAIAVFILLLGAVNFINLSTAQSVQRAKEIGVRKVMGSGRGNLVLQFLTETAIVTTLAVIVAVLLVNPAMGLLTDYIPTGVKFHPFAPANLGFLLSITVITTLLAGFYPAKVLASYLPVLVLKGAGTSKGGEKWWLRKALIVFQFTISLVFIIVSLLIGNQIRYMLSTDYGFKSNAVVAVQGADFWDSTGKIDVLKQRYSQIPGIAAVVVQSNPPAGWGTSSNMVKFKGKKELDLNVNVDCGDESFIPFYDIKLLAGRNIRHSDSLLEFVINETTVKSLGFTQPHEALGQTLYYDNKPYPIVGVVADFHEGSLREAIRPVIIGMIPQFKWYLGVKLASEGKNTAQVKTTLDAMEKAYKEIYPTAGWFAHGFMDDLIARLYESEQKTSALINAVMILAITISCMGLFGLALFTARRKAAEISIRKVLGATTADIAALLNKGFIVLVLLALLIATPIAWFLTNRWLQEFAYRPPFAWWVFPVAGAGAILIAIVTVSFQSIRAALANPIKYLRTE